MSCAGRGTGQKQSSNDYLYSQFKSDNFPKNLLLKDVVPETTRKCRNTKNTYPSFTPILLNLSLIASYSNIYTEVNVIGSNFLPNGTTFIKFGLNNITPIYYNSNSLSFTIPLNLAPGEYNVQVVNIYNNNFSPQMVQNSTGIYNYSDPIIYTIVA
jgi:hypothetical protein